MSILNPGDKVRLKANPARLGILGNETDGPAHRQRVLVSFLDGSEDFVLPSTLEKVENKPLRPYECIERGRFSGEDDLRAAITFHRLSGKLANLIYSLNTTNTQFLAYQFKPVLQFLDSPCNGILIADEVGLGKTIEAGLIWTELRARLDAKRLLVVCPAMLREKWRDELANRFGVLAEMVDAGDLLKKLQAVRERPQDGFAVIASMQGLRPPRGFNSPDQVSQRSAAKLARFLEDAEVDEPLLDMVVVDEAHYLRNKGTQTNLLGRLLRPVASSLVMLSATPIQLRSSDLFNLLNLIDEDAFPYEESFRYSLEANAPIVRLRDRILAGPITRTDFVEGLDEALEARFFEDNEQITYLRGHAPSNKRLADPKGRAELADQLDRINPLSKVVTRTLKRDVHEGRVVRAPYAIRATMSGSESDFYEQVTEAIRGYCVARAVSTGFMLTIPQRQMSSCMAAACRAWQKKHAALEQDELEETLYDLQGDLLEEKAPQPDEMGSLLSALVDIAREVGDYETLRHNDSKYAELLKNLRIYWADNPGKKVVLFAFYRQTLAYLAERLREDGYASVLVQGGMDKQQALARFQEPQGPSILLSSEVASEGVDLQFSSLVINYDLPWNPMRIEQRIGRIDRIGQEAERIMIWNFMYADTIDERVYDRLLDRLNIFTCALGSMEGILGEQIRELTQDLLTHKLTPEEETQRINQASLAIENTNRQQEELEAQATQLIAHSDFIQNKVRAAKELGRYIRGEDLLSYARDFLIVHYPGSRFVPSDRDPMEYDLELSVQARVEFAEFVDLYRLQGRSQLLSQRPKPLLFENRQGNPSSAFERVTQDHPLIRFVTDRLRQAGKSPAKFPVSAIDLAAFEVQGFEPGIYVFGIYRWTVSGTRDIERLEYVVRPFQNDCFVDGELAEHLVNTAALCGSQWLSVANELDTEAAAAYFDACRDQLDERFDEFQSAQGREDRDRLKMMKKALQSHLDKQVERLITTIQSHRSSGEERRMRMIPAAEGKLKKLRNRFQERIAELELKSGGSSDKNFVTGGVIRLL
ncbi:SNF2-related protein [Pseudomonas sp. ML2-2023-3]|uniref:SNF2-related protein n=1 Tax=Pseudomonas sp. ML2-2023-3 TaxID=3122375 RepID=UPI0030CC19EB